MKPTFAFWQKKLDGFIRLKKLRRSRNRVFILRVALVFNKPFTAIELATKVRAKHPKIAWSTVYAAISIFMAAGVLDESELENSRNIRYWFKISE